MGYRIFTSYKESYRAEKIIYSHHPKPPRKSCRYSKFGSTSLRVPVLVEMLFLLVNRLSYFLHKKKRNKTCILKCDWKSKGQGFALS